LPNYFKNPILTYKKDVLRLEDKASTDLLNQIANELNNDKSLLLEISGFMDKNERPKTLSADRAKVIFDHLYGRGINPNQVIRKDFGSSMPGNKKNKKPNSRVELQMYAYSLKPIERQINAEKPLSLQITEIRPYEKGTNPLLSQVPWQEGKHKVQQNGRVLLVQINSIEKPRAKNFEETKGQIISDYQVYLENEWVENLRKMYEVKVDQAEFQKLIKP